MGLANAQLTLSHPFDKSVTPVEVTALADSGAITLVIPPDIADKLHIEEMGHRIVELADGRIEEVPMTQSIRIQFEDRSCEVNAVVTGREVLLGAVPMELMDLVVEPLKQRVTKNPAYPNLPHMVLKGWRWGTS